MDTPANQPWDFGQAVAEWSTGVVKGVAVFFGLVMKPFDNCGLGHESEGADNDQKEDESVADDGCLVVDGGGLSKGKDEGCILTEEALDTLSLVDGLEPREPTTSTSRSSSSSSNTLNISSESSLSGSVSGEESWSDDCAISAGAKPRVTFEHGVDVRIAWHAYLASRAGSDAGAGRVRAATMVDGDEFSLIVESAAAPAARPTTRQPQRMFSRAALFAMVGEDGGDHDENGQDGRCKPIAYGRMKDIVSSSSSSSRRSGANGSGGEDGDEEGEVQAGLFSLSESYDGSIPSMKGLVFPPTYSSSRYINSRPVKRIFDFSKLASRSRAEWMTQTELDDILGRTNGWKDGVGGSTNGRRSGGRRARRNKTYGGFDGKLDSKSRPITDEMARVSVDNTVLKDQLFGLAMEEHRASLLFKRAFLNWEGSSSNL